MTISIVNSRDPPPPCLLFKYFFKWLRWEASELLLPNFRVKCSFKVIAAEVLRTHTTHSPVATDAE